MAEHFSRCTGGGEIREGGGRLGRGRLIVICSGQARETLTLAGIYLFAKRKGGGSAIPVFFHISTYVKLGLLIQREKKKSEKCTGKGLGRNMSTKEGIRLEINEHF